ncbi:hypothetical protein [Gryllotalpicola koreensis]|uniref:Uncharacterized protein n=1 Tax=Gryllotalpicola koreensis TaxID=993086 RepID=A0ABP7ZS55_9MICO
MIAAILAWVFGLALVGLIVAGLIRGRGGRKRHESGVYSVPTDDAAVANDVESRRGQLQELHGAQSMGPGGV